MNIKKYGSRFLPITISVFFAAFSLQAQENVLLRTDRDIYIAGEDVHVMVNCLKSGANLSSELSNVVYVELLNAENAPINQHAIELEKGGASATISLDGSLSTGNYYLRAYTKWMCNFNPELHFNKSISVINPFASKRFPNKETLFDSDTVFVFFEGARCLANEENHMLVQTLDKKGRNVSKTVKLKSSIGNEILDFTTDANGLSSQLFTPGIDEAYTLEFESEGSVVSIPLQQYTKRGSVLHLLEAEPGRVKFQFREAGPNTDKRQGVLSIVSSEGQFLKSHPVDYYSGALLETKIDTLVSNNLCAYLLDSKNKVVASRYFRCSDTKKTNCTANITGNEFKNRQKVDVTLKRDAEISQVSVSVVKKSLAASQLHLTERMNLTHFSDYYLNSLVKGSITFNDVLMAFNPLLEFQKSQVYSYLPECHGQLLTGTLSDKNTQRPIVGETLMLNMVGPKACMYIANTDSLGNFCFEVNTHGIQEIVIQPYFANKKQYGYTIDIDPMFCETFPDQVNAFTLGEDRMKEINAAVINMQINAVYSIGNNIQKTENAFEQHSFYGEPEYEYIIDEFIDLPAMEDIIMELVQNVSLRKQKGKYELYFPQKQYDGSDNIKALAFVDGVPVWNVGEILKISPKDVTSIDVEMDDYFFENIKFGGFVNIHTKTGDLSAMNFDKGIFRQAHEFFAPPQCFIATN